MESKKLTCRHDDNFTIGFDAEFIIQGPFRSFVPAFEYIGGNYKHNNIGLDGITDIGEIRGFYSTKVPEIIQFVHKVLREECPDNVKMHRLVAGAYPSGHPVGCHIHFGNCRGGSFRQAVMSTVGLLLMLIEPRPDGKKRFLSAPLHTSYGKLDYFEERAEYMGTEYKMPWSFIVTPELMFTILTFAKLIAKISGNTMFGGCESEINVTDNEHMGLSAIDIYNNRRYDKAKEWFLILIPKIRELPQLYKQHKELDFVLVPDEIEVLNTIEKWVTEDWFLPDPDVDLRKTWATFKEKIQFIYSHHFTGQPVATKSSLRPIYVRIHNSTRNHVTLSGFSPQATEIIVEALKKKHFTCNFLKNVASIRRACPTVNLSQPLTSDTTRCEILEIIRSTLNKES